MEKTTCCNFRFECELHNPIRDRDGYCMSCGYHPEIERLKAEVKELDEALMVSAGLKENPEIERLKHKEDVLLKLTKEVTQHIIDYHCEDEFNIKEAFKCESDVNWMLQTRSYRKLNLPLIELLATSLDLILHPDEYKQG